MPLHDADARAAAVDPRHNVVLEASAGTGKTRVLVGRYVNLIRQGVDPANILAITFTRKAAAEMRERIVDDLRRASTQSPEDAARWRTLRDRLNEIAICTIDAFCLLLLREFPLEADLDPDFQVADETEMVRLVEESLDGTLRIARSRARTHEDVALLFAQLGEARLREGLAALLGRRQVAALVLRRVLAAGPRDMTGPLACARGAQRLTDVLRAVPGGLEAFLNEGPVGHPRFRMLAAAIRAMVRAEHPDPASLRSLIDQLRSHFLTKGGDPRKRLPSEYDETCFSSKTARTTHQQRLAAIAVGIDDAMRALRRDLNVVLSRAVWQVFQIAADRHRRTLESHGVLDFGELLARAGELLSQMDEFARSRFLLEARYHHVLVDEFQDTSRAQWELVLQLVRAWGEGLGLADDAPLRPSIFIVGDRKQSIFGFRDAEVAVLDEAAEAIGALRVGEDPLRSIRQSFRSAPPLLAFANDVFQEVVKAPERSDAFRYDDRDQFPLDDDAGDEKAEPVLGVIADDEARTCAAAVAAEISDLVERATVRDRQTGLRRPMRPGDVAILFRSRSSHREFERALESRRIPSYVYKGLGFFDADEVKDIVALVRYVADPASDLRAAALLRSRFVRLSDPGLQRLAPGLATALSDGRPPEGIGDLDAEDQRVLGAIRASVPEWLALADRIPPAELVDWILNRTAYAFEIRGARAEQARENVKKMRALIRRIQNRGYLTLGRLAADLDQLSAGDESNAVVDALDAVSLMTVHSAKGLEFPVVFVVNLARGAGGPPDPIRIAPNAPDDEAVAVGDFQAEFDEDVGDRDSEELKRLLYVAITRARDRLYLSSATKKGVLTPGRGSLASVLPKTLRDAVARAAQPDASGADIEWQAASGRVHRFRRSVAAPSPAMSGTGGDARTADAADGTTGNSTHDQLFASPSVARSDDDFGVLADPGAVVRAAVTDVVAPQAALEYKGRASGRRDRVAAGRLVHRLFQFGVNDSDPDVVKARARTLLDEDERHDAEDPDGLVEQAVSVYRRMRSRSDIAAILGGATCFYEVPVSLRMDGAPARIVRGVIDCLACAPSGEVVVIDFKTGVPRETDRRQLDVYVEAARGLFPDAPVRGVLVYPSLETVS
ncbi:MAG: UvrD-helicase domain-containing protein [Acidobacteria bacterium]|nr:UvrD-helicase domain-containing protein [Acidobacteriota bacterium]